jgi:hypothetical protein
MSVETYRRGKIVVMARRAVSKAYGDFITAEKRNQLDKAESALHDLYQSLDILHELLRNRDEPITKTEPPKKDTKNKARSNKVGEGIGGAG